MNWREMPAAMVEAHFNPRVASKDAQGSLDRYAKCSAEARALLDQHCEVREEQRYGPTQKQTYDLYRHLDAAHGAPLVVFIHGGYWRALDKSDHSFVVPPLIEAGAVVINLNYDLCPDVTLDEICAQAIAGVRHCHANAGNWGADPERLILVGHSAGAHLAARVLNAPEDDQGRPSDLVFGVAAISGIYEPQVILRLSVNEQAEIDADAAQRNDCMVHSPKGNARIIIWAGGDEPEGWIDQSRRYAEVAANAGMSTEVFELPSTDHFTVLEQTFSKGSEGWRAILKLLQSREPAGDEDF